MGGRAEQGDVRLAEPGAGEGDDSPASDGAVELRALWSATQKRRPLLFYAQRWFAKPERNLCPRSTGWSAAALNRSEHAERRRHGGADQLDCERGRQVARVWAGGRGIGLARV